MTREAGRELDAEVARRVMEIEPIRVNDDISVFTIRRDWLDEGDYYYYEADKSGTYELPHYSTDIAAAWEVVERLRERYDRQLEVRPYSLKLSNAYRVAIRDVHAELDYVTAPTAPLAICLAALAVVEGEP